VCKLCANKKSYEILFHNFLIIKWAHQDLNLGPPDYESGSLYFYLILFFTKNKINSFYHIDYQLDYIIFVKRNKNNIFIQF